MDCCKANEEETQVPETHLDYMIMGDEEEGKTLEIFGGKTKSDESCAQHGAPKEIGGRESDTEDETALRRTAVERDWAESSTAGGSRS